MRDFHDDDLRFDDLEDDSIFPSQTHSQFIATLEWQDVPAQRPWPTPFKIVHKLAID
jgi:hypothetical protein